MVNEDKLSAVLSEFARTLITDFPIQKILDHLVTRIVDVLPVTSAGVTLISPGIAPRYVAASDESALSFEGLQSELRQGPCLTAYETGEAVSVCDIRADNRFPSFAPAAQAAGLGAVFAFPLRHDEGRLGALDLYHSFPLELDQSDMDAAQTLADVAAAYLLNAQAREEARVVSDLFHHSALHDPLTGLPNRLLLQERLEHAVQRARRSHTNTAVLFVDLDRFKRVNDTHGHHVGDELLVAVGQRLSGLVRSGDTLARFSGDEFVFVCEDLHFAEDVEALSQRLFDTFATPFVVGGLEMAVTASVGIAFAGPGEAISDQLLAKADAAMYQVKRKGGAGREIVDMRETLEHHAARSLQGDLYNALAKSELDVAYQPIVRTAGGAVIGVEALLRWTHPERGPISPRSIIAIAEQSELINEISAWVLERSFGDYAKWMDAHPTASLDLAVNVSARQLNSPSLSATVSAALDKAGMDPRVLILEMTESVFIEDSERTVRVLSDLKQLGLRLALDDFGSGYSSLSYLSRLSIDIIKIDRGFIANICHDPTNRAIVEAVLSLSRILGLTVIAEGVESQSQRNEIAAASCEFAQGFYYAAPMPPAAINALVGGRLGPQLGVLPTHPSGAWRDVAASR